MPFKSGAPTMWLKDFDYVKTVWSQSPPLVKVLLLIGLFLSSSEIASLPEKIVKWKGFFRDGFAFYHQVVSEPLTERFLELGLRTVPETVDCIVIFGLLTSAFVRMRFVGRKNNARGDRGITRLILLGIFYIILLLSSGLPEGGILWLLAAVILISPVRLDIERQKAFYIPIVCTIFAVCIIAAINGGLSG